MQIEKRIGREKKRCGYAPFNSAQQAIKLRSLRSLRPSGKLPSATCFIAGPLVAMRLLIEHSLLSFPILALRLFPSGLLILARPLVDVLADQLISSAIKDISLAVDIDRAVETSNRQVRVAPVITGYAFNFCRVHCCLVT